jgi:FkbM family methyltransferase
MRHSRKDLIVILGLVGVLVLTSYQTGRIFGAADARNLTLKTIEPFLHEKRTAEIEPLAKAYGPSRNSESVEEWILKDFFQDQRDGVFVEVGANHHQSSSNTYYLETALGWSGVAIEPQVKFAAGYKRYRPRTTFVPLFISDVSNRQATLYVTERTDLLSSGNREYAESFGEVSPTTATTSTLDDVLDRLRIERIDFLSIDIELAEPQALAGFSVGRFAPRLVAIEAHQPVRQQILDYFAHNRYVLLGKYWQADDSNFWFAPLGHAGGGAPLVSDHLH